MRRTILTLVAVILPPVMDRGLSVRSPAQTPDMQHRLEPPGRLPGLDPPPTPLPQSPPLAPPPAPQKFDNTSLRLKADGGRWQLWAGNLLLKDFGPSEQEASEALQVFRDLRVNSRASIGGVFEYWLTDGQAPSALTRHRTVIPFDPRSLRIEQQGGQWVLRDAHVVLYGFGRSRTDAEMALAACRQYEFDQLGFVGHPTPVLKYLMKDPAPRTVGPATQALVPASAVMTPAELPRPRLWVKGVGEIGDRIPFDGRRLDLRRESGEWVLYAGRAAVGHFGPSERDARTTLELLEQFRVTELCRVGESGFGFFLSNGRAPAGTVVGTGAKPLRTDVLNVRQVNGSWAVCEGSHPLFDFGERADDARHLLAAIREFHFDHVAAVGNGRLGNSYLFVKTQY